MAVVTTPLGYPIPANLPGRGVMPYLHSVMWSHIGNEGALSKPFKAVVPEQSGEQSGGHKPSRSDAEAAVRTLLAYAGEDTSREGLIDTPARVVRSFDEFYAGYEEDPVALLERTFEEVEGYDEVVLLKDIDFVSHCEHHMAPIIGHAHVAYLPRSRVVGISKLARVVDVFARRLQIQEKMTAQIANAINDVLNPKGVAVMIDAAHQCMSTRGVNKRGVSLVTSTMLGTFRTDPSSRQEVLALMRGAS